MSDALEKYKEYMDNAHWNYTTKEQFEEYYGRVPKFRYDTMRYCWDQVLKNNFKISFFIFMKIQLSKIIFKDFSNTKFIRNHNISIATPLLVAIF